MSREARNSRAAAGRPFCRRLPDRAWPRRRKSCSLPGQSRRAGGNPGRLAQLVEHLAYTERVGGSSPSPPTSPLGGLARGCAALSAFCAAAAVVCLAGCGAGGGRAGADDLSFGQLRLERLRRRLPASHRRRRRHRGRDAAGLRRFRQTGVAIPAAAQPHLHEFAGRQRRCVDGARRRLPPAARRGGRRRLRFGRVACRDRSPVSAFRPASMR